MSKVVRFALVASAVALLLCSSATSADRSNSNSLFNGTSLAGWHPLGGKWHIANGEIVGSVESGRGNSLVLDHGYEDFIFKFAFRCESCGAGVLLRMKPS